MQSFSQYFIEKSHIEAHVEGRIEGPRARCGTSKARHVIAHNLLLKHIDIATVAEATGLSHDEIAERVS